jgi:hypothetical protein
MQLKCAYKLKKSDIVSAMVMAVILVVIFLVNGVDHQPGISPDCEACRLDIGPMARAGHYEEMCLPIKASLLKTVLTAITTSPMHMPIRSAHYG